MQLAKGFIGARWLASDPNGDPLIYTVEIRGVNETQWKLLKDKVTEKYLAWDSTAFPDGEYRLRVTASDAPGNPPGEALTTHMESAPFLIDNTPPKITGLAATRNGGKLQIRWHAADALNNVDEGRILARWRRLDGGRAGARLSDSPELDYDLTWTPRRASTPIAVRVAGRLRQSVRGKSRGEVAGETASPRNSSFKRAGSIAGRVFLRFGVDDPDDESNPPCSAPFP